MTDDADADEMTDGKADEVIQSFCDRCTGAVEMLSLAFAHSPDEAVNAALDDALAAMRVKIMGLGFESDWTDRLLTEMRQAVLDRRAAIEALPASGVA